MKKKIILIFNVKSFFIYFLIITLLFVSFSKSILPNLTRKRNELFYEEKYPNINDSFNRAKEFLDKCLRGKLIKKSKIISQINPIASTIIPIFNSQKNIERAVRSIQNQNIENYEIILIDDFSTDNTSSVIKDLQKEDKRIKIINNKKNMGTLYSRCIGVLSSLGEYIFHLDSDDMFLDKDVIATMINITFLGNFDLISFKAISTYSSENILLNKIKEHRLANNNNFNKILHQPELGLYSIREGNKLGYYKINDNYLWNKCIKAKLYRKALNKITKIRFSRYMIFEEDRLIVYILFNVAESMKYINKYGILIITRKGSVTRTKYKIKKSYFLSILYFTDVLIDLSKKSLTNRKILIYIMTYLLNLLKFHDFRNFEEYDKKLFISCLKRIIDDEFVSNLDKEKMIEWALSLIFRKK